MAAEIPESAADVRVSATDALSSLSAVQQQHLFERGYVVAPLSALRDGDAAVATYVDAAREAIQIFLDWSFAGAAPCAPTLDDPSSFGLIFDPKRRVEAAAWCLPLEAGDRPKTIVGYSSGQLQLFQLNRILQRFLLRETTFARLVAGSYLTARCVAGDAAVVAVAAEEQPAVELDADVDSFSLLTTEQHHLSAHIDIDLFAPEDDERLLDRVQCVVGVMSPSPPTPAAAAGDSGAADDVDDTHPPPLHAGPCGVGTTIVLAGVHRYGELLRWCHAGAIPQLRLRRPAQPQRKTKKPRRGGGDGAAGPGQFQRGASFTSLPPEKFNAEAFSVLTHACYAQQDAYGMEMEATGGGNAAPRCVCPALRLDEVHIGGATYRRTDVITLTRAPFKRGHAGRVDVAALLDAAAEFCAAPRTRIPLPPPRLFEWISVRVPAGSALFWVGLPHANTSNRTATTRLVQIVSLYDRSGKRRRGAALRCEQSRAEDRVLYSQSRGARGVLARRPMAVLEKGFGKHWNALSKLRALPPALQRVADVVLDSEGDYWSI